MGVNDFMMFTVKTPLHDISYWQILLQDIHHLPVHILSFDIKAGSCTYN